MKKSLKVKLNAFLVFKQFCESNRITWESNTAFLNAFAAFETKIQSILSTEAEQQENNKGVARTKAEKKLQLTNLAVSIAAALQGYAIDTDNPALYDQMNITPTDIYRAGATNAISNALLVADTARELDAAAIAPYGITPTVISALDAAIDKYTTTSASTRNVIVNKSLLTADLTELVNEANVIMRKQLIKIGFQFKVTDPNFYAGMVQSAKLIEANIHTKLKLTAVDGESQQPLTGVIVEVEGTGLQGVTDMYGKCTVTEVPEGPHTIRLMKTNYDQTVIEGVEFKRGKSTNLKVAMAPNQQVANRAAKVLVKK